LLAARPPVQLYLSTSVEKGGPLWGAASHPTEGTRPAHFTRPQCSQAMVAPRGRADDVSLPRPNVSDAAIPPPCAIPPEVQTPRAIQKKGIRTISKLGTDAKNHPTHITRGRFPSQLCTALELQRIAGAVRRNRFRNTTARAASALCTRNTFSAKSKPIVLTSHGRLRLADLNGPPCHIDAVAGVSAPSPPLKANRTSRSLAKSLTHRQGEG